MARSTNPDQPEYDESEWDTVAEESAEVVAFSQPGQSFVGSFVGEETIEPPHDEPFTRYLFRDKDGELRAINQSYKMLAAMEKVQPGDTVRVTYIKDIQTRSGLNPLKDFKVQVRRNK